MQAILWPIVSWIFRQVVIKFAVLTAIVALVSFLVPLVVGYLGSFISPNALNSAFGALPSGVQYMLLYFRFDYGLPLLIAAIVARFLIRRLPVVG